MTNIFLIGLVVSIIYLCFRFLEMRVISKENKPLKILVWDTIIVYLSVVSGLFVYEQLMPMGEQLTQSTPAVFTGEPDF
jgi:hypothetical protein